MNDLKFLSCSFPLTEIRRSSNLVITVACKILMGGILYLQNIGWNLCSSVMMKSFILVKSDENRRYSTLKRISETTGVRKRGDEFRTIYMKTELSSHSYRILSKLELRES